MFDIMLKKCYITGNAQRKKVNEMTTHTLTTEQLRKLTNAIGDDKEWPKITDDPRVNYAVDCLTTDDDEPEYDKQLYLDEAEAFKALG